MIIFRVRITSALCDSTVARSPLVIVESIVALHRAEFTGRGTLAERQQRLKINKNERQECKFISSG
jgi:hypothetical protein